MVKNSDCVLAASKGVPISQHKGWFQGKHVPDCRNKDQGTTVTHWFQVRGRNEFSTASAACMPLFVDILRGIQNSHLEPLHLPCERGPHNVQALAGSIKSLGLGLWYRRPSITSSLVTTFKMQSLCGRPAPRRTQRGKLKQYGRKTRSRTKAFRWRGRSERHRHVLTSVWLTILGLRLTLASCIWTCSPGWPSSPGQLKDITEFVM
ncbi:hypothetical protein F5148DRAFT_135969 [Russula earlei]|uniref:Uncharacterized protein n=1 Tax=Russula earlei TaxID=71964 RepID=A0ACC0TQL2_9AGAM|nr:hypothetical protein F5148DRAFT_135969 [Russula earlei]